MENTAEAVGAAVEAAFAPTESAAPEIVRRDEVREKILGAEWKDESAIVAERTGEPSTEPGAESAPPQGEEATAGEANADPDAPPPESVIEEHGNRIVVRTGDGKFAPAPDVKLEFAVGDKVYLKSPAELVRMARDGVAGQQFRQEVQQYREQVPQLVQQFEAMQSELEAQRALNLELLNDEMAYQQRREQWEQLNSPQERLRRMEQQQEEEYQQRLYQQQALQQQQQVAAFYQQELKPVQDAVLGNFPQVSLEAKLGRISIDTMPLLRNGVIPPERLPEYKAYLDGPFRDWVQSEAARIDSENAKRRSELEAQLQVQRAKAQAAVQSVGRQLAPTGRTGPDTPPPPPKPRNREEAKALIINRAWQG